MFRQKRRGVTPSDPRGSGESRSLDGGISELRSARAALRGRLEIEWIDFLAEPFAHVDMAPVVGVGKRFKYLDAAGREA
jgi:hypothetical protein